MYTAGTSKFGIWKHTHRSQRRLAARHSYSLVLALGTSAFISWLIFFLTFKIRGEFYFFETSNLDIPAAAIPGEHHVYFPYRQPAAAVGIIENSEGKVSLIFDDGRIFAYPTERNELERYVKERSRRLELITMITKSNSRTIGRVQFWVEREVSFAIFHEILDLFSHFGFDDFDLALTRPSLGNTAQMRQGEFY